MGILMGSDSDLETMEETARMLERFKVPYEMTIASAHRSPDRAEHYAENAEERGIEVLIVGAGMAAHLPGAVAAETTLPVIGVPMETRSLSGMDSLYSIVQMPKGVPVACLSIGHPGASNAGILATQILANKYPLYRQVLKKYKEELAREVDKKAKRLEKFGYKRYFKGG